MEGAMMAQPIDPLSFFDQYPRFYATGNTGAGPRPVVPWPPIPRVKP